MRIVTPDKTIEHLVAKIYYFSQINEIWSLNPDLGIDVWNEIKRRKGKRKFKHGFSQSGAFNIWRMS